MVKDIGRNGIVLFDTSREGFMLDIIVIQACLRTPFQRADKVYGVLYTQSSESTFPVLCVVLSLSLPARSTKVILPMTVYSLPASISLCRPIREMAADHATADKNGSSLGN